MTRMADASGNPYTAVAAVLQAARLGFENKYELPAAVTGDGFEKIDAKESVATALGGAIKDLEKDVAIREALGQELVDNHIFMKTQEVEKCAKMDKIQTRDFYLPFL